MKVKKIRIENLSLSPSSYLLPKDEWPEHPSVDILYWTPNEYYGNEDKFESNDGYWFYYKDKAEWNIHFRVHKDCFKHPETSFTLASFDYDSHENFYELHFCEDRPLALTEDERKIFWELVVYGNKMLNESSDNEDDNE